jgi:Flp pilus assembly protein TadD
MLRAAIGVALVAAVAAVYAPVLGYGFLQYDDPDYVTENRFVRAGVTIDGLGRALEPGPAGNWHPLTWLSHMLDVEFAGLDARFHHATSVALHALVAVLAFVLFDRLAGHGASGRDSVTTVAAGLSALAFALHPLRVESVAWISERKDVLSLALGLAAVLAWLRYCARPGVSRYVLVATLLALGLAAKSVLVTLPVLFLLLDVWPLGRLGERSFVRLVAEKLPFVLLASATGALVLLAQHRAGSLSGLDALPLAARLGNAAVAIAAYLGDLILPIGLGPFYPYPEGGWSFAHVAAACGLVVLVTAVVSRAAAGRPWLALGWVWFVIALLPVLGLVQVGVQARADRYTYLPQVGLFAAAAIEGARFARLRSRAARLALAAVGAGIVAALALGTAGQIRHWRDTEALFLRALDVTSDNHVAHYALSIELVRRGEAEAGLAHAEEAVRLRPRSARAQEQLGACLARLGRHVEALARLEEAARLDPRRATVHARIGAVLLEHGRPLDAIPPLEHAARLAPDLPAAHANLGQALARSGRLEPAVSSYRRALELEPDSLDTRLFLGAALVELGRLDEAERELGIALEREPTDPRSYGYLAAVALARGDLESARARAETVRAHDPRMADVILARVEEAERQRRSSR